MSMKIGEILSNRGPNPVFPTEPRLPLFDGVDNPKIRALLAIALGCYILPEGVPGLRASNLNNILKSNQKPMEDSHKLAKMLCQHRKSVVKDPQALLCIVNLLLYKKTNSDKGYIFGAPMSIEIHNEAFAVPDTLIVDGPRVIQCGGCSGVEHSFLEAEGSS